MQFPITSISEPRLLKELGLSPVERNQIQGLTGMTSSSVTVRGGSILTEAQLATIAIVRLAHDPPTSVGKMQRITAEKLLRPCIRAAVTIARPHHDHTRNGKVSR